MRLSAYNDGELKNVIYLLTPGRHKIRNMPAEMVVRQAPCPVLTVRPKKCG